MIAFTGLALVGFLWVRSLVTEHSLGNGGRLLEIALQIGIILFVLSELMVFVGFFWAWFMQAWSCTEANGPLPGVDIADATGYTMDIGFALLNTMLLVCSGFATVVAQSAMGEGRTAVATVSMVLAIVLAALFTYVQGMEYAGNVFDITTGVYGTTFYTLTGLHGLHVQVGTTLLILVLIRLLRWGATPHIPSFVLGALFYWHFVDVVWLFLFVFVYMAPNHVG